MTVSAELSGAFVILALALGDAAIAQTNPYRNYTQEKFVDNMQAAGRNYAAVADLLDKGEYESAKGQLTRAREQLAITITFWRDHNRNDAVAMLRRALSGIDSLDAALGAASVDPAAVRTASARIDTACNACHMVYREQDPVTKAYRLKPASIQ
jgi:cytochrome c556